MHENPFENFKTWFEQTKATGILEPTAMTVATATKSGTSSCRTVLLKAWDERGFVFYTNENGRKGKELAENPQAALLFYWMDLQRQIRIEGNVEAVSAKESDDYYHSRELGKRIGAWASKQSEVMGSHQELEKRIEEYGEKFGENPPRPEFWHGYRVVPKRFEFWQEGKFRLHQRDVFERQTNGWKHFQIYP